ncbi:hypothetical protein N8Z10_01010 [bacterium]|nr:hypothetical protein [bacterium]
MWKTKEVTNENGSKRKMMICQNSKPELSKWSDYAPEEGVCSNYGEVGKDAVARLCWQCTARSVNGLRQ